MFDFNAKGDKVIKNKSSIRQVPIHRALVDRVIKLRDSSKGALFDTDAGNYSKHFMTMLRNQIGISDKRKVFHSFRHTMKDNLRNAGVDLMLQNSILGHTSKSVGESYGSGYSLDKLNTAINSVECICNSR